MTLQPMQPVAKLAPWPYEDDGNRADGLDFTVKIDSPTGWFDLEDGVHYAVHGDSFTAYSQTFRRNMVSNEWIEGSYPITAVRENVTEPLVVWTRGETRMEERTYREKFIAAIEQLSWTLMVRYGNVAEYWSCFASDYAVETQREFIHAGISVVRATVTRLPYKQVVDATSDEV